MLITHEFFEELLFLAHGLFIKNFSSDQFLKSWILYNSKTTLDFLLTILREAGQEFFGNTVFESFKLLERLDCFDRVVDKPRSYAAFSKGNVTLHKLQIVVQS